MVNSCRKPLTWSKLPKKTIRKVSDHLKTRQQILKFKHVCKKWRKHSIPIPVNILSLTLPLPIPISTSSITRPFHDSTRPLVLQVSSIYLITPTQTSPVSSVSFNPWMIMVQESNPGKIILRHPLTAKRVKNVPRTLNLTQFPVTELAQGYNFKDCNTVSKVLLCSSTSRSSSEFMVLYRKGMLGKLTVDIPENYSWKTFEGHKGRLFWFRFLDDIVHFKKMLVGVDRKGKLYVLDTESMTVVNQLVSDPICRGDQPNQRRKRLVVDSTSDKLYLVVRECAWKQVKFTVYKFNEHCKKWNVLERLGSKRILFVGVNHCFFGRAKEFPGWKGNCIVFAANCFTQYRGLNSPDKRLFGDVDVEVGVYRLGKGDNFKLLSSAYPEFSKMIWPPPTWFSPKCECDDDDDETDSEISSSQQASGTGNSSSIICLSDDHEDQGLLPDSSGESSSDESKDEEMVLDSSSDKSSKESDNKGTDDSEEEDEEEAKINSSNEQLHDFQANFSDKVRTPPSDVAARPSTKNNSGPPLAIKYKEHDTGTSKNNNKKNGGCLGPDFSEARVCNTIPAPVTPAIMLPLQACTCCSSTVKFEGLDIKSELLPTLQTIWAKHGSLIGEDTVCSKEMRAFASESVAKLMITLQNTTVKTLTDSRAEDTRLILSDLQRLGLKVDWLVPAVEKALQLQKSKPMIESIMLLNKKKAQVDKEEKEFLARTAKVKKELEEDMACLSARIPFSGLEPDACLGDRLF